MYGPAREMIHNVPYFDKSHHRLDKFHLLTKEWKDNVSNKINIYYNKVKCSLKNDYVTEAIENIVLSLENKLEYVAHYKFMSVSTFRFLGDSIVEAANSRMKCGSVSVGTNMTINMSESTQIKISENQSQKKNKYVTHDNNFISLLLIMIVFNNF